MDDVVLKVEVIVVVSRQVEVLQKVALVGQQHIVDLEMKCPFNRSASKGKKVSCVNQIIRKEEDYSNIVRLV